MKKEDKDIDITNKINTIGKYMSQYNMSVQLYSVATLLEVQMSKDAQRLLVRAKNAQEKIAFGADLSGYYLGLIGEQEFVSHSEDRKIAEWKDIIRQLVDLRLISQVDTKGQIFQLTSKGYRIDSYLKPY